MPACKLAAFSADVTPPEDHPLCGGWIEPVRGIDDPLWALGVVLLGPEAPVVLCAVDWCGLRNDAHLAWRQALARAAHTTPERVGVHCVHPHNAPFADTFAQRLLDSVPGAPPSLDLKFFDRAVSRAAAAFTAFAVSLTALSKNLRSNDGGAPFTASISFSAPVSAKGALCGWTHCTATSSGAVCAASARAFRHAR